MEATVSYPWWRSPRVGRRMTRRHYVLWRRGLGSTRSPSTWVADVRLSAYSTGLQCTQLEQAQSRTLSPSCCSPTTRCEQPGHDAQSFVPTDTPIAPWAIHLNHSNTTSVFTYNVMSLYCVFAKLIWFCSKTSRITNINDNFGNNNLAIANRSRVILAMATATCLANERTSLALIVQCSFLPVSSSIRQYVMLSRSAARVSDSRSLRHRLHSHYSPSHFISGRLPALII